MNHEKGVCEYVAHVACLSLQVLPYLCILEFDSQLHYLCVLVELWEIQFEEARQKVYVSTRKGNLRIKGRWAQQHSTKRWQQRCLFPLSKSSHKQSFVSSLCPFSNKQLLFVHGFVSFPVLFLTCVMLTYVIWRADRLIGWLGCCQIMLCVTPCSLSVTEGEHLHDPSYTTETQQSAQRKLLSLKPPSWTRPFTAKKHF